MSGSSTRAHRVTVLVPLPAFPTRSTLVHRVYASFLVDILGVPRVGWMREDVVFSHVRLVFARNNSSDWVNYLDLNASRRPLIMRQIYPFPRWLLRVFMGETPA